LFVDDDKEVLNALQRLLRSQRDRWELVFALGGPAALREVQRATFDVVVTDMRMPELDGAGLLDHVRDRDPTTLRMVLSGFSGQRALPVAHQFFDKPCAPKTLIAAVGRACELRTRFADERLLAVIDRAGPLPLPALYHELKELLDPDALAAAIARVPAIATRIMRFARARSIREAVVQLGRRACAELALYAHAVDVFGGGELLEQRAFDAARQADPESFAAALVAEIGIAVIAAGAPGVETAREREVLGTTHADVGAYVLASWCIPLSVIDAVAQHAC
jgi:CheY-like chemotaxis protein